MKKNLIIIILGIFAIFEVCNAQLKNNLLWRVSGNGLKEPSYIFGTIHLAYEKFFEIGDSTYLALKSCKQFASEVNIDSMWYYSNTLLSNFGNLNKFELKRYLSQEEISEINKRLYNNANRSLNNIDFLTLLRHKELLISSNNLGVKKSTFLAAHLFQIARCLGKPISGLENYEDINTTYLNFQIKDIEYVNYIKKYLKEGTNSQIIDDYLNADIEKIYQSQSSNSEYITKTLIIDRNIKFVNRIITLMNQSSTFIAVDAAHLGSKNGIIQLLKEQGYKVEAVQKKVSNISKIFKYDCKNVKWNLNSIEQTGIEFELPFLISEISSQKYNNQGFFDFGTGITYMINTYKYDKSSQDSIYFMMDNYIQSVLGMFPGSDLKSKKELKESNYFGYDTEIWMSDNFVKMWVVSCNEMLFIIRTATFILNHDNYDIKRFFSSIKFNEYKAPEKFFYHSPDSSFSVEAHGIPNINNLGVQQEEGFDAITQYQFYNLFTKKNLIIMEIKHLSGFYLYNREYFHEIVEKFANEYLTDPYIYIKKSSIMNGLFKYEVSGKSADTIEYFKIAFIVAFNKSYIICGINYLDDNMVEIDSFINSFLINFKANNSTQNHKINNFSFSLPSSKQSGEVLAAIDSSSLSDMQELTYSFTDSISGLIWYVNKYQFNEFYQADSDSIEIIDLISQIEINIDSLNYFEVTQSGNYKYFDYKWTTNDSLDVVFIGRLMLVGKEYLNVSVFGHKKMFDVNDVQKYLKDISFTGDNDGWSLADDKKRTIFNYLKSENNEKKKLIKQVLFSTNFDKSDFVELSQLLLRNHFDDEDAFSIKIQILRVLKETDSIEFKKFVIRNFDKIASSSYIGFEVVSLLSSINDKEALKFSIAKLAKINTISIRNYNLYSFFINLINNDLTFKNHFKELIDFYHNKRYSGMIASLFLEALQEEKIKIYELKKYKNIILSASLNYIKNTEIMLDKFHDSKEAQDYEFITELMFYLSDDEKSNEYFDRLFEFQAIQNLEIFKVIHDINCNLPISDELLFKIAYDKSKCSKFLSLLKIINRLDKFPVELSTVQHLSKSLIHDNFFTVFNTDSDNLEFLGEVRVNIENNSYKYLFYEHKEDFSIIFWVGPFSIVNEPLSILNSKIRLKSKMIYGKLDYSQEILIKMIFDESE